MLHIDLKFTNKFMTPVEIVYVINDTLKNKAHRNHGKKHGEEKPTDEAWKLLITS